MESWKFHHVSRGHADYEAARRAASWNGRVPDRFPELIVYPESDQHVQAVIRYAKENALTVAVKSGGHSWTVSFLRNGGILVDMIKMKNFTFDIGTKTAQAQSAVYASDLNAALLNHQLMFPGGHCPTVGLGGFLLAGGFGWNSRKWGLACESVYAIDVVTADGDLIHADSTQNSEYLWAARGSGHGYFGLITKFYLKLHPLPLGIKTARYVFELADLDEVLISLDSVSDRVPPDLEICMFIAHDQDGFDGRPTLAITADALSETEEEARSALDLLHNLPVFSRSIRSYPYISCTLRQMMDRLEEILDNRGLRYEVDNLWTQVSVNKLLPSFHKIIESLPPAPSHLYMTWWLPIRTRGDMAFSLESRLYVAIYAITTDSSRDSIHQKFVRESMELMSKQSDGTQLADENLISRPSKFMTTQRYVRLEKLRQKYDPEGRFWGYMNVPEEFKRSRAFI